MRIFAFVAAQKADFPVRTLCRFCKVSPSGFYAWAARLAAGPGPAAVARQIAAAHIARVHAASRRRYGSPRVTALRLVELPPFVASGSWAILACAVPIRRRSPMAA